MAVVIVLITYYEPNACQLFFLRRDLNGWHVAGEGPLGFHWQSASPHGDRGVITFGLETRCEVTAFDLRVNRHMYTVPVEAGYGAAIIPDSAPDSCWEVTSHRTTDGLHIAGFPPPLHKFRAGPDARRLEAIGNARHFLWATQRQIERYVISFNSIPYKDFPRTVERQRVTSLIFADAEFLLNSAAQTVKSLNRLQGPQISNELQQDIKHLRDLHEHWEQHKSSFAHPGLTKKKAGVGFAMRHPGESPWVFRHDANGCQISVLRVEDLWNELELIDKELGRLNNAELEGTCFPHIPEDENRPVRPMPQP